MPPRGKAGLQVVRASELTLDPGQTPGMNRYAGIAAQTVGAQNLWVGFVTLAPSVRSGAHHHGDAESGIYMIKGHARFRFGALLDRSIEAGPGDFVHVPPRIIHQEINLSGSDGIEMIVVRDHQENVVVNLDLPQAILKETS
ncbi:MAG: cupin domain-containing protein [Chloroflexi bacterium]|nr:cupin domain-containing protein [Chloroflexota bacterium]